jgi:hypothetical protein
VKPKLKSQHIIKDPKNFRLRRAKYIYSACGGLGTPGLKDKITALIKRQTLVLTTLNRLKN